MTYRNCKIEPDPFRGEYYSWYHPQWVNYDPESYYTWSGIGNSIQECIKQIDQYYEDSERQ
jgi:hypothetical protein